MVKYSLFLLTTAHSLISIHPPPNQTPPNIENPPSTQIIDPVTNAEASLNSQTNAPINSSGLPKRLKGVFLITLPPLSVYPPSGTVDKLRFCSVRKKPGASAFIRMASPYRLASSTANHCV